MKNTYTSTSRRNFIKGVIINGAALSAVPAAVLGNNTIYSGLLKEDKTARLPLRIMMKAGSAGSNLWKPQTLDGSRVHLQEWNIISSRNLLRVMYY